MAAAGQVIRHRLSAFRRPGVGRLPLIASHGVIANLRGLGQRTVVLAFQKVIKPSIGDGVIIEARVAQVAIAYHSVFRGALVAAMRHGRDDGVLLVGDGGTGGLADVIVGGKVGADADVIPGHEPEAGNVDAHAVVPEAALVPGGIVGSALRSCRACRRA